MSNVYNLKGFVRDIRYTAKMTDVLTEYSLADFDITKSKQYGTLAYGDGSIGYSCWKTPKRTRSYPFERIYNTYNTPRQITIIPVIKDEGRDAENDRIQYSTISWMNLLNIYIVLAYYKDAKKNMSPQRVSKDCLTGQVLDNVFVRSQIDEIIKYKLSALHWNRSLFEDRFVATYKRALDMYENISKTSGVAVHPRAVQEKYLDKIIIDYNQFSQSSLRGSQAAVARELKTTHYYEDLSDGIKSSLEIENYLGGIYHLTVDEVIIENGKYILQESKNGTGSFPSNADIKDGLFKLILYSNIDTLHHGDKKVDFSTRLKLTGKNINSSVRLPCSESDLRLFLHVNTNTFTSRQKKVIDSLNQEAIANKLTIDIVRSSK